MKRCSVQPRDRIFVKGYGFLSFAKNMGKNIGKNISKSLSGKYSQKLLDHAKQSTTDTLKKVTKVSNYSQQNNLETVTNENNKEIPNEKYISPEKRHY